MIEIEESSDDRLLVVKVIEKSTEADIEKFIPVVEKHVAETANARMMLVLEGMEDWSEVIGLWSDLNLDTDYVNRFERIAAVGDPSWKGWLTGVIENLVEIELKFFGMPDLDHARQWVIK